MKNIILDTDIGGDPDDLFTLFFALGHPEISVELIITNDEHKGHRKLFVQKLLKQLNIDIPVYRGIDFGKDRCCCVCDLVDGEHKEEDFTSAIRELLENKPDTQYLCIGPNHNLAAFIQTYPDLSKNINYTLMGAMLKKREKSEHNIRYDIPAARYVLSSDTKKKYVSADVTNNPAIKITEEHEIYQSLLTSSLPCKDLAIASIQNFFKSIYPATLMHDPLTLATLVDPSIVKFRKAKITINDGGFCHEEEDGYPIKISTSADYEKFMKLFDENLPF